MDPDLLESLACKELQDEEWWVLNVCSFFYHVRVKVEFNTLKITYLEFIRKYKTPSPNETISLKIGIAFTEPISLRVSPPLLRRTPTHTESS